MEKEPILIKTIQKNSAPIEGAQIGKIVRVEEGGKILVNYPENKSGPIMALVLASVKQDLIEKGNPSGCEVLLNFVNNDPQRPIIVGVMYSLVDEIAQHATAVLETGKPQAVTIKGKLFDFSGEEKVVIRCGKSSITLTKDGEVMTQGVRILSDSSGTNIIRGGSIKIN
jgi:hypothetical protein